MIDLLSKSPLGEASSGVQICRTQNQAWATTLVANEQEIDQLLTLLADLPNDSYRSLYHRAVDYTGDLASLKSRFQQIRLNMVCEGIPCTSTEHQACREPRFGLYALIETHFRPLTDEFSRIKDSCYQFLNGLMTLNLI
jgi:hypothetical protein